MSSNFAESVASIIDLNMIDARFASLTKEFIILYRQPVLSSILFKYRYSPGTYMNKVAIFIIAKIHTFYPFDLTIIM